MYLSLENIRCFSVKQRVQIRPLTLLVGENSSGKSTFLSVLHAAVQADFPAIPKIFNQKPFEMGGFDTIATFKGGKYGRAETFSVGFEWNRQGISLAVHATFEDKRGAPSVKKLVVKMGEVVVDANLNSEQVHLQVSEKSKKLATSFVLPTDAVFGDLPFFMRRAIYELERKAEGDDEFLRKAQDAIRYGFREKLSSYSMSPLRTEPKRTYDESSDLDFAPGGDHIPRFLSQLDLEEAEKKAQLFEALNNFGKEAGLFDSINVKHHGRRPSDPFQVRVVTQGPAANLVDVGYGVSQALPILVEVLKGSRGQQFILQQPEVHLHPRAQAALGSFFAKAVSMQRKRFVVETHSDFLIDRIRYEVAKGRIKAEDVQILFFERPNFGVNIWEVSLDTEGNIVNAPRTYREFFLDEEMRLMSRGA